MNKSLMCVLLVFAFSASAQYVPSAAASSGKTIVPSSACQGSTDATAVVQSAINSAIGLSGELDLPSIPCHISQTLTISGPLTIRGQGCFENWGTVANSFNVPTGTPPLIGSGFVQTASAKDILDITVTGQTVNLYDFCGQFGVPYSNTGNGIVVSPHTLSTYQDSGLFGSIWQAIKIYGHDGNHYAFKLTNSILGTLTGLRSYGGGSIDFENNSGVYQYGNSVISDFYGVVFEAGSGQGIKCGGNSSFSNVPTLLLTFIRPQIWVWSASPSIPGVTPPTTSQLNMSADPVLCQDVTQVAPDYETNIGTSSNQPVIGSSALNGALWINSVVSMSTNPSAGTPFQNTTGTMVAYALTMQLNPTVGAAATTTVYVCASSSGCASSGNEIGFVSSPAGTTSGEQQNITAVVPSGYWLEFVAVNSTRVWSGSTRIPGF